MLSCGRMDMPYRLAPCPACGAAEDEEVASREEILAEMEALWEFHLRRLRPGVPRRFLTDRVVFSQDPPLRLGRCVACGTLFRNPVEEGRELLELYAEEPVEAGVLRALFEAQLVSYRAQARRLTRIAGSAGVALEVGSYVGGFQAAAAELGWLVEGVDVNAGVVAFARANGLTVHHGDIGDVEEVPRFDAITIWNCFDQLPDPRLTVQRARARLRPGGLLALRVPNGGFYTRMRPRLTGPGAPLARGVLALNNLLGFPYRNGFTAASLGGLLSSEGFTPARVVGDTLVPTADRWTRRWARLEERSWKRAMAALFPDTQAPWLEIYATKD